MIKSKINHRNVMLHTLYFLFFMVLLVLLTFKSGDDKEFNHLDKIEVIKHTYDEPKDFVERKDLSKPQKDYYEYLYNKTE